VQSIGSSGVDVIEAGGGPLVVLVHSSVSGARQWRRLIEALSPNYHVLAPNLIGYGATPPWHGARLQTLDDQADVVAAVIPDGTERVSIVGHSFGGAIAMTVARRLGARVDKLILLEPNPFALLRDNGNDAAFAEIRGVCDEVRRHAAADRWDLAAERFGDYWGGEGTWASTPAERRIAFQAALRPNLHEWDAVMGDDTPLVDWGRSLPAETVVCFDPATKRPIREIVDLLRGAAPQGWKFIEIPGGGHMAPLSRPALVNPIVERMLRD
jgi:pimeloyl-ACP methyl ester carboxylesterase